MNTVVQERTYINDNPRVENLWQYLKRRFNYRTGIVTIINRACELTRATGGVANIQERAAHTTVCAPKVPTDRFAFYPDISDPP